MSLPSAVPGLPPAKSVASWRVLLRGAGILIAAFIFCFWAAKGYNTGWTKNSVPVERIEEITEVPYIVYEERFVPGIEFLGGGMALGLMIFAVTFWPARGPRPSA
jgi:hypothetical protein